MPTYYEKLRDPRWQRKRLEVMQDNDFQCEHCGDAGSTLNVHHRSYRKGADPWDYAGTDLACLCEACHKDEHHLRDLITDSVKGDWAKLERVAGYAQALLLMDREIPSLCCNSYEFAQGVSEAFRITVKDVLSVADHLGGIVTFDELFNLSGS